MSFVFQSSLKDSVIGYRAASNALSFLQRCKEAFPPLLTVRLILRSDHHPVDSRKTAHGPFDTLFELLAIETRVLLFGLLLSLRSELFGNRLLGTLFSLAQYQTPPISQHVKKS